MAATAAAVGVPETTPVDVLSDNPAGSDGEIANTRVPAMPVEVYAVVEVIAVPTVALTVCAAGVSVVFADTLCVATGRAMTLEISTNAAARRFMGGLLLFP